MHGEVEVVHGLEGKIERNHERALPAFGECSQFSQGVFHLVF